MHPLDGPRLKVWRAKSELHRYRLLEHAFMVDTKYQAIRAEINPKTGNQVYRASDVKHPPVGWGVWIGEIVHNVRSALDGLVHQLAILNGAPAGARGTQFPIFLYPRTRIAQGEKIAGFRDEGTGTMGSGVRMIKLLRDEHKACIERLQPYQRGRGGKSNALYRLNEISNADKHRLLQIAGAKVGISPIATVWGADDDLSFAAWRFNTILKDGTKLGEVAPKVRVHPDFMPLIVFGEGCRPVKGLPIHLTLDRILEEASEIIESFRPEF